MYKWRIIMKIIPEFSLTWLNGLVVAIPFLFIRLIVMKWISPEGARRADFFAPQNEKEKPAMQMYNITGILALLYPPFLSIKVGTPWFWIGLPICLIGLILLVLSTIDFAKAPANELIQNGIYRYSRNPMYLAYAFIYTSIGILTASWLYLLIAVVRQYTEYIMILSEERWCLEQFGEEFQAYLGTTRRYWGRKS
jgi:protein-S-isoprenylcysteine O-methyltransferase Ste14